MLPYRTIPSPEEPVLSALGIATGTKLFHGLPALVSDTITATRGQVNK